MAITDSAAIKFCNEQIRPSADRLARSYYRSKELSELWNALTGTNDERFALLADQIEKVANLIRWTRNSIFNADRIWNSNNLQALIPNDAAEEVWDNLDNTGQDTNRPPLTGQDVRRVKFRMEEYTNHWERGTDVDKHWVLDTNATLPIIYDYLEDAWRLTTESAKVPTGFQAMKFASERCGDIVTEYETTNPAKLTHILIASVNPRDEPEL